MRIQQKNESIEPLVEKDELTEGVFSNILHLIYDYYKYCKEKKIKPHEFAPIDKNDLNKTINTYEDIEETIPILTKDQVLKGFTTTLPIPAHQYWKDYKEEEKYKKAVKILLTNKIMPVGIDDPSVFYTVNEVRTDVPPCKTTKGGYYMWKIPSGWKAGDIIVLLITEWDHTLSPYARKLNLDDFYDMYYGGCESYEGKWTNDTYHEVQLRIDSLTRIFNEVNEKKRKKLLAGFYLAKEQSTNNKNRKEYI